MKVHAGKNDFNQAELKLHSNFNERGSVSQFHYSDRWLMLNFSEICFNINNLLQNL